MPKGFHLWPGLFRLKFFFRFPLSSFCISSSLYSLLSATGTVTIKKLPVTIKKGIRTAATLVIIQPVLQLRKRIQCCQTIPKTRSLFAISAVYSTVLSVLSIIYFSASLIKLQIIRIIMIPMGNALIIDTL